MSHFTSIRNNIRRGDSNKKCQPALPCVWWFCKFGSGQRCHHRIQKWSFYVFYIFFDFLQDSHTKYWILQKSWRKPKKKLGTHVHLDSENHQDHYVSNFFQDSRRHPRVRWSPIETSGSRWCCKWSSNSYYTVISYMYDMYRFEHRFIEHRFSPFQNY